MYVQFKNFKRLKMSEQLDIFLDYCLKNLHLQALKLNVRLKQLLLLLLHENHFKHVLLFCFVCSFSSNLFF